MSTTLPTRAQRVPTHLWTAGALWLLALLVAAPGAATTYTVTNGDDAGPGSYRQAIADANADADPEPVTIVFDAGLTVSLSSGDVVYTHDQPITLEGNDSIIDGGGAHQILDASAAAPAVTVEDLTMRNGFTADQGGAIEAAGAVTVIRSTFADNRAGTRGGAIRSSGAGDVTITDSTFSANAAERTDGGALHNASGETVITGSTFVGNTAGSNGGAIQGSSETLTVTNSTFVGNSADNRGGAYRTFSGHATFTHVTFSSNSAPIGAHVHIAGTEGELVAYGTVLTDPLGGGSNCDIRGTVTSEGYNYDTDGSCGFGAGSGDVSGGPDPQLGPLADNGGPTETMLPQPGSPLIDAIPAADCDPEVDVDQRGIARPQDGNGDLVAGCDIGAVEVIDFQRSFEIPVGTPLALGLLALLLAAAGAVALRTFD